MTHLMYVHFSFSLISTGAYCDSEKHILFVLQIINGRKPVGGKLEVKVRIRNPILSKQVVTETEKWIVVELPQ